VGRRRLLGGAAALAATGCREPGPSTSPAGEDTTLGGAGSASGHDGVLSTGTPIPGDDATSSTTTGVADSGGGGTGEGGLGEGSTASATTAGDLTEGPELCSSADAATGLTAADLAVGGCAAAPLLPHVYVLRDAAGFYAMTNQCTHNGCKVKCADAEGILKCPCHGSWFDRNGEVIKGPAPSYLDHYRLAFCGDDAQIFVDPSLPLADRTTRASPP